MSKEKLLILIDLLITAIVHSNGKVCYRLEVTGYTRSYDCISHHWWHGCLRWKLNYHPHYRAKRVCCPGYAGSVRNGCSTQEIRIRLIGGDGYSKGTVQVSANGGSWGTVCDDRWSNNDATVACRMLGFRRGEAHSGAHFGSGTDQIFLDEVQCDGSENSLSQCRHAGWENHDCDHSEDAGVTCSDSFVQKPQITRCSAVLTNIRRSDGRELYRYVTDSTNPNVSTPDTIWTNQKDFNYLNLYFEAMHTQPNNLAVPWNYKFGVTSGEGSLTLEKIQRSGEGEYRRPIPLPACHAVVEQNGLFKCNVTQKNFDRLLEGGDVLKMKVVAISSESENVRFRSNSSKAMEFRFDFEAPKHCSIESGMCGQKPLHIDEDITKEPIYLSWNGWNDDLAGLYNYTVEFFKLQPEEHSGFLKEENASYPLRVQKFNNPPNPNFIFPPSEPGMYSFIMGVVDAANNVRYCRRVALFDDVSTISTSDPPKLIVTSAVKDTNYSWQSIINDGNNNGVQVSVSWDGHFMNKLHKDKKFLNRVLPFSIKLPTNETKIVENSYDDHEGRRTIDEIPNSNGIVSFEVAHSKDHSGGKSLSVAPSNGINWITGFNSSRSNYSFSKRVYDGDTVRVWIKARDAMGNVKIDYTDVTFDSSRPVIESFNFQQNIESALYPFASRYKNIIDRIKPSVGTVEGYNVHVRFSMLTYDTNSGIYKIKWKLKSAYNGHIFKSGEVYGNKTDKCSSSTVCTDIPTGEAFNFLHTFDINNCWMIVDKDKIDTQMIILQVESINMAMLSNETEIKLPNLRSFTGLEDYSGPESVKLVKKSAKGAQLKWKQAPICYERSGIEIIYKSRNGRGSPIQVHNSATSYDIFGLTPQTNYTVKIYNVYGTQRSNAVVKHFTTSKVEALSAGGIAGIAIVMLILLGFIIAGIVLWRTGKLNTAKQNVQRRMTVRRVKQDLKRNSKFVNVAYQDCSDDIYIYGGMVASCGQNWLIPHSEIILESKLSSGRFADIFRAKRQIKQNNKSAVVAKVLHENFTDEDEFIMKAKINFFATEVGNHPNVIAFVGAVMDHPIFGPFMLLEFCEKDTLKIWLDDKRQTGINEETFEQLCRISYSVAKGLDYLASKKIVHRRLAARNILLTSQIEAKISGFGPSVHGTGAEDQNEANDKPTNRYAALKRSLLESSMPFITYYNRPVYMAFCFLSIYLKRERIPIKWMAPECMESTKHANEASDVWSYGIVLWEIFSLGETPYPNTRSHDVQKNVKDGYRMERPEYADDTYYDLMRRCWHKRAKSRPTFQKIAEELGNTFMPAPSGEFYY